MYINDKKIKEVIEDNLDSIDHFYDYDDFDDWKNEIVLDLLDEFHIEAYTKLWDMKYALLEDRVDKMLKEMHIDRHYVREEDEDDEEDIELTDSRADVLEETIMDIANRLYMKKDKFGLPLSQKDLTEIITNINHSPVFKRFVEQSVRDWIKTKKDLNV